VLINGMLSHASVHTMLARLKRLANEFSQMHTDDALPPVGGRRPAYVVLAMRPWELDDFHTPRRRKRPDRARCA
jgi:hypothetical protein